MVRIVTMQVLHIIDKVLEPTISAARDPLLSNPDAGRLLERAGSFNLGSYQIRLKLNTYNDCVCVQCCSLDNY